MAINYIVCSGHEEFDTSKYEMYNYCPRCGEPEETVTHEIFECPPAIQAWALSSTPLNP